ncbi:MAG: MBL fold metallo-hydrolase, partial [Bacillota bacterium]|nr:MBL fold metallo-hydrolase [Bacillota bacterium]
DHKEKVLYTGDNLEKPIVYVEDYDIQTYIDTLENYLKYYAEIIVSGHTLYLQNEDILKTIKYLKGLKEGRTFEFQTEYEREIHMENLQTIIK